MSENLSWRQSGEDMEQRFGHILLQTTLGEVYSLDLYSRNNSTLAFSGYYLPPTDLVGGRLLRRWERLKLLAIPSTVSIGMEFLSDASFFKEVAAALEGDTPSYGEIFQMFGLPGSEWGEFELYADISPPTHYPDRTQWSGMMGGKGGRVEGNYRFVLEQYGTIDPILPLLVVIVFFVGAHLMAGDEAAECYNRAAHQCGGERNVRSVNITKRVSGMTFSMETTCQFECKSDVP